MSDWILVAIPLFVVMATVLQRSGIAENLFMSLHRLFGRFRGGLAISIILICVLLGACTGVISAALLTMGLIGLPNLTKQGYQKPFSCGVVMSGGCLSTIIPPSIMLVVMGQVTGISVGKLFMAAIFPGLMLASLYVSYIVLRSMLQPASAGKGSSADLETTESVSFAKLILPIITSTIPPVLLIVAVLGSIYAGIATPNEAAAVGALCAVLLSIGYKKFNLRMLYDSCLDAAIITSLTLVIIASVTAFTTVFMGIGGLQMAQQFMLSIGLGKWALFFIMIFIVFILGMFMDWPAIVLITFPIFIPIANEIGFDKIWFVISVAIILQTSYMTPPFGFALFLLRGVAPEGIVMQDLYRGVIPFILLIVLGLVIVAVFPQIVTWLPSTMIR
jgi:tripartite ATP-independent transporter DctM subunit